MNTSQIPLELVKVASPCKASWDGMVGDDRARFCGQCSQYVFNLSELTQEEAEALITEHEGKMCVRFYQRIDGTIMTKDCPIGWRAIKRRIALVGTVAAAVFMAMLSFFTFGAFAVKIGAHGRDGAHFVNPVEFIHDLFFPPAIAGEMCPPANQPAIGPEQPLRPDELKK
jgi:hypothetical protein